MTAESEDVNRDRKNALRMIAPQRAIETRNIETYWEQCDTAHHSRRDEAEELWAGKVVLVLPDGSRWVHVNALLRHDSRGDNRYIQQLRQLLLVHMKRMGHTATVGGLSDFSLNAASLDLQHVFCHECTRCVDLLLP
jgi:hypothetical protein